MFKTVCAVCIQYKYIVIQRETVSKYIIWSYGLHRLVYLKTSNFSNDYTAPLLIEIAL